MTNLYELACKIALDSSGYTNGLASASQSTDSFGAKLSSGLVTAAQTATAAITAVGSAAVAMVTSVVNATAETAAAGDAIDKTSQKLGVSAEFYQEWDAVMKHSGTSMDSMTQTFKTLANATQDATDDQKAAFEALGLSMEELQGMSTEEVFTKTITALQNMEAGTLRTAYANDLLGRGAMEMGALLNTSAEDTQAMIDTVRELGGVMSTDAVKSAAKYQDTLQDMQTSFSGLKRNMISGFMPSLTTVMKGLTALAGSDSDSGVALITEGIGEFADKMSEKIPEILDVATKIIDGIASVLMDNLPLIINTGATMVISLVNGVLERLPEIIALVGQIIGTILSAIRENGPSLIETFKEALGAVVQLIIDNIPLFLETAISLFEAIVNAIPTIVLELIDKLPTIIETIINLILDNLPTILEAAVTMFMAIVQAIPIILDRLLEKLPEIITMIFDFIIEALPQIVEAAVTMFMGLIDAIPLIIEAIIKNLPQIISAIVQGLIKSAPVILQAAVKLFGSLGKGLSTAVGNLIASIPSLIRSIVTGIADAVTNLWSKFKDIGGNIIKGLVEGIKSFDVGTAISNVAGGIVDGFKNFLGIHSPSTLFRDQIGYNIGAGLSEGLENSEKGMLKTIDSIGSDLAERAGEIDIASDMGLNGVSLRKNVNLEATNKETSALVALLNEYLPQLANMKVVLDGKATVGALTSEIDSALGLRYTSRLRGAT